MDCVPFHTSFVKRASNSFSSKMPSSFVSKQRETYDKHVHFISNLKEKKDSNEMLSPTMQFKEGFGVKFLWIQSIRLLPDFPQLSNATLSITRRRHEYLRLTLCS